MYRRFSNIFREARGLRLRKFVWRTFLKLYQQTSISGSQKIRREFSPGVVRILTWGGLRGGISVALALGIPKEIEHREVILVATYVVST